MGEACDLSAVEARRLIGRKELSPVELLESCVARVEQTNKAVNAIVAMDVMAARRHAMATQEALRKETAERLRVLEELRKNGLLLLQQSRMAALGEMIGNIWMTEFGGR